MTEAERVEQPERRTCCRSWTSQHHDASCAWTQWVGGACHTTPPVETDNVAKSEEETP